MRTAEGSRSSTYAGGSTKIQAQILCRGVLEEVEQGAIAGVTEGRADGGFSI